MCELGTATTCSTATEGQLIFRLELGQMLFFLTSKVAVFTLTA